MHTGAAELEAIEHAAHGAESRSGEEAVARLYRRATVLRRDLGDLREMDRRLRRRFAGSGVHRGEVPA